jgi:arylsulfatase A-like enzyme
MDAYAGKIVRIDVHAGGNGAGRVAWGPLSILTPNAEEAPQRNAKNVVVLTIDTLRADKLRPFNPSSRVHTPILDRIAAQGSVFLNAQSAENWTKPSVASILTGLYPASHGAKTSEARLPRQALLLSEHLQSQGFATGGFIANGYVSDKFGFDQGWDRYTNYIREQKSTEAENVFKEAGDWIEENRGKRFFAYIQTIEPHVPYDPPDQFLRMYDPNTYSGQISPRQTPDLLVKAKHNPPRVTFTQRDQQRLEALHDGEITYHDSEMGKFIERLRNLGVWGDTLFVVTSDHGEEFNDHGSYGHGHSTYQELLHVPLLFHMPGLVPANKIAETVGTLDIPTTVLAGLGLPDMPASEGIDLFGHMRGAPPAGPTVGFSDFLDDRRVITAGRWKLVLRGINASLFDLQSDPGEQGELDRHDHPIAMRYCRTMLGQFLGATNRQNWLLPEQGAAAPALQRENAEMDETIRGQLEALGYAN